MLTIYDPVTLTRIWNFTKITSSQWTRRFYDVGSFEIHLPPNTENTKYLKQYNIIYEHDNFGIILYLKQTMNDIEIRGYDLKGICSMRLVIPPFIYMDAPVEPIYGYDRIKGKAETVMKHYIKTQLTEPTDLERKINNMRIETDLERGADMAWQAKFTPLSAELQKIGIFAQLGYNIILDRVNKRLVFDVTQGKDRTKSQSVVAPVVFSRRYQNIDDFEYENDSLGSVNTLYVGGNGEEEQQYITKVYKAEYSGIHRVEGYTGVSSDDVEEVEDGGMSYLEENNVKETIEANANQKLKYKEDWFLGDYVSVIADVLGEKIMLNKQITEVQEVYEHGNVKIKPTFGEKKDSVIKRLIRRQ